MDATTHDGQTQHKTRRMPRITALGVLATVGVIAIFGGLVAAPVLGWQYYKQEQQQALARTATDAWAARWAESKDADGKPLTAPALQGIIHYPSTAFIYFYQDPATGKGAAMSWMSNQELPQTAIRDVWVPLAIQEPSTTAPAASSEAGK